VRITWKTTAALLACALVATLYVGIERWELMDADVRERLLLTSEGSAAPFPTETVDVPQAQGRNVRDYDGIAAHNLFSGDRSPTVIVVPPAPTPIQTPRLPVVFGVVSLRSGIHALMAENLGGTQIAVGVHDAIGEFMVVALDVERIVLAWHGENLAYNIADLMYKANETDRPPLSLPGKDQGHVLAIARLETGSSRSDFDGPLGREVGAPGASRRECASDDPSPSGSVVRGYRKLIVNNSFGTACSWVMAH
jgi:hypothetical protein